MCKFRKPLKADKNLCPCILRFQYNFGFKCYEKGFRMPMLKTDWGRGFKNKNKTKQKSKQNRKPYIVYVLAKSNAVLHRVDSCQTATLRSLVPLVRALSRHTVTSTVSQQLTANKTLKEKRSITRALTNVLLVSLFSDQITGLLPIPLQLPLPIKRKCLLSQNKTALHLRYHPFCLESRLSCK